MVAWIKLTVSIDWLAKPMPDKYHILISVLLCFLDGLQGGVVRVATRWLGFVGDGTWAPVMMKPGTGSMKLL
jgi:hypothetical protein